MIKQIRKAYNCLHPERRAKRVLGSSLAIQTHMSIAERMRLFDLAYQSATGGGVLEIGSYLGASSASLAEGIRRKSGSGYVYCIDTWQNDAMSEGKRETLDLFLQNTRPWNDRIRTIQGDSRTVDLPDIQAADLVFIDGDHSYQGAKSDADRFAPLVREGGLLAFHDTNRIEVARVIGELMAGGSWIPHSHVDQLTTLRRV